MSKKQDVEIRLAHKDAKKLLEAMEKGEFIKLKRAEAKALGEFVFELRCSVTEGE